MANHEDFEELDGLLPFFVNGTLGADDRARIEVALAASHDLRANLVAQEQFAHQIKAQGEKLMEGSSDVEERLITVLGDLPDQATPPKTIDAAPASGSSLKAFLGFLNPGNWHPAVSLALAVAVLAQGAWIVSGNGGTHSNDYQTVSGPDGASLGDGPMLIIRPAEDARWADVERLLEEEGLTLVSGPNEGRLTVRVDKAGVDLTALSARLRADPGIAFVGEVK
jgi:hypothetical protein